MTYLNQMKDDIVQYIAENGIEVTEDNMQEVSNELYDLLWDEDSVTWNGSGSYTFDSRQALEYIREDGMDYVRYAIEEFDLPAKVIKDHLFDWEYWDVTIRCYLLGEAIEKALDGLLTPDR